jgi:hypothetical protein
MTASDIKLKELPAIVDTGISGIRLANTLPKALPPLDEAGSKTSARQIADAEFKRDMSIAFAESKALAARSKAIRRIKNRQNEQKAKNFGLRRR